MSYTDNRLGNQLLGVSNCPHCGISNPQLFRVWQSDSALPERTTVQNLFGLHFSALVVVRSFQQRVSQVIQKVILIFVQSTRISGHPKIHYQKEQRIILSKQVVLFLAQMRV